MIVPLLDDDLVVMENVFRHPLQGTFLECPSGGRNPGEASDVAARRELEEETGYRAGRLEHLGCFSTSAGISDERVDLFLGTDLTLDGRIERENTEQMEICTLPFGELHERALGGKIDNGATALALMLAWQRRRR